MVSISSFAPMAQPPPAYTQVGQIPVGQESTQQRLQRIRPVEQAPSAAAAADKKHPDARGGAADAVAGVSDQDKRKQARQAINDKVAKTEHEQLKQLAARDREVRAHEQAHKAVAGSYGGAISYKYERGPDGNRYAVGGEVSIDTSPESSPEATLAKARTIQRAANAPAEPSDQDRAVAAQAVQMEQLALQQIAQALQIDHGQQQIAHEQQEATSISADHKSSDTASVQPSNEQPALKQAAEAETHATKNPTGSSEVDAKPPLQGHFGSSELPAKPREMYRSSQGESLNFHAQA